MSRARGQEGFSLVEVMVVVAILGFVAMMGFPSLRGLMPRIRLNSDTMVLANEIALTRARAIAKSSGFTVELQPATDRYAIVKADGGARFGETALAGTDLYNTGLFNPGTGVFTPSTPPSTPPAFTLAFAPNGQVGNLPLGKQAFIELRPPGAATGHRKQIRVESTGRVTTWRWSGGDWTRD